MAPNAEAQHALDLAAAAAGVRVFACLYVRDATVCGYIAAIGVDDAGVLSTVVVNVDGKPPLPDAELTEEQRRLHACLAFLAEILVSAEIGRHRIRRALGNGKDLGF